MRGKRLFERIFTAVFSAAFSLLLSVGVFAEGNALENYQNADWQGDKLFYDDYSGALYFRGNTDKEKQSAVLTLNLEENATGFFFFVDGGNGNGSDSGYVTLTILDGEGNSLFSTSTGNVEGFANFSRFSVGEEEHYYPIPKSAEAAEITFTALQKGSSQRVNIYFRNFNLLFSDSKPLSPPNKIDLMDSKAGLSKVEVGVTAFDRWFWIVLIFAVAMVFFLVAKWRQKYISPKIMKGTNRRK